MSRFMDWLFQYQPEAERILDHVFHGRDPNFLWVLWGGLLLFGIMLAFFHLTRLVGIFVLVVAVLGNLATVAARLEQCVQTRGTVTYQFSEETEPNAVAVAVMRCRTRPVGVPEYGPWYPPSVRMMTRWPRNAPYRTVSV